MFYAVSDIHGNLKAFNNILEKINLQENDTLFILGDVIDRNPHGIKILQRIMKMPNARMLLGNHEYMMMNVLGFPYEELDPRIFKTNKTKDLINWYQNGGSPTHKAFKALPDDQKEEIKNFLQSLPLNITVLVNGEYVKLVHALPEEAWELLKDQICVPKGFFTVWDRDLIHVFSKSEGVKVIFGHTPTVNLKETIPMEIYNDGSIYGIDCGAAYGQKRGGRLCCLRLDDMEVIYSD